MGHLPDPGLHKWKSGDQLTAAQLTHNFTSLFGLCDLAMGEALRPDEGGEKALLAVQSLAERVAGLELRETQTEREKGTKQYTPLATFGAFVLHVNALTDPLAAAAADLRAEVQRRTVADAAFAGRLTEVEARPAPPLAPTIQQFRQLEAELAEARAEAEVAVAYAREVRAAFHAFRAEIAEQVAILNRAAGINYVDMKARMDAFEASTAAEGVAEMRKELAAAHRLIADTDRKEELHKYFTPRSAFAFLMHRVERLEKRT